LHFLSNSYNVEENRLPPRLISEIESAIGASRAPLRRGSASTIKKAVLSQLQMAGWSPEVVIDSASKISITSIKNEIGLCFQTGNICRIYADLLKLQAIYRRKTIRGGVVIVPTKHTAKASGKNLANYERLTGELKIFADVITLPLVVYGLEWGVSNE
jgi:hypothetical protein